MRACRRLTGPAVAASIVSLLLPASAQTQAWPTRPVTMVVTYAAGVAGE